jgi:peptidyl-prolyl cis-trans isomerase SurA
LPPLPGLDPQAGPLPALPELPVVPLPNPSPSPESKKDGGRGAKAELPADLPELPPSLNSAPKSEAPESGADPSDALPPLPGSAPQSEKALQGAPPRDEVSVPKPPRDPAVKTVAADPTMIRSEMKTSQPTQVGRVAARVGDQVITLNELTSAVEDKIRQIPANQKPRAIDSPTSYYDFRNNVASAILEHMIDRTLVIQEFRRQFKDPKKFQTIVELADKTWRDEELPVLLRKTGAVNEQDLKRILAKEGKSITEVQQVFRQEFLFQGYLAQKLAPRMRVDLPQMRDYYNAHLDEYHHPSQITWREVEVAVNKYPSREAARQKAQAVAERLRRGEDFAAIAAAESDGATKSKGGLWFESTTGSYAVASVNAVLESLPLGQTSAVIEGPSSFHIVRVEARRPAGASTFAEVQDKVKEAVLNEIRRKESTAFIEKLRSQTPISTIFDGTASAPLMAKNPS